jgi:hypothetical protein
MGLEWQVDLNRDITVATDGRHCVIGGVVSVRFEIGEVDFVWSEGSTVSPDPLGVLHLRRRNDGDSVAMVRLSRSEALRLRTMIEAGGPGSH